MQDVFNDLIQVENNSAFLYLAMSNYFNTLGLRGFGQWFRVQYEEELGHALKLTDHLIDRNAVIEIKPIPQQPVTFGTATEAFQQLLAHEQDVTQMYKKAYEIAKKEKDPQSLEIFLEFLKEQVEEEGQVYDILGKLQINKENPAGILLLDQELGKEAVTMAVD